MPVRVPMLLCLPNEITNGYELMLMHAQKIPLTSKRERKIVISLMKAMMKNRIIKPTTPIDIICFLPNLAPRKPAGIAAATKATEKKARDIDASVSVKSRRSVA